jgi:hypothetical protein
MKVMAMIRDRGCAALIVSHEVELIRKVRERRIPFAGGNSSGHVQPRGLPNLDLTLLGCENGTWAWKLLRVMIQSNRERHP